MTFRQSYTYSDIGLIPTELSTIKSRDDVDPSIEFLGYNISLPILVAPMDTVVGETMWRKLTDLQGLACLPRNSGLYPIEYHIPSFALNNLPGNLPKYRVICVDVANSFNKYVENAIADFKEKNPDVKIITGNIASIEGYRYMEYLGVDAIRCGIGPGQMCSTSIKTGIGVGQVTLIRELAEYREKHSYHDRKSLPLIIADGGIKNAGDVVKALALGADCVMAGTLFGGCEETPGPVIKYNNKLYKQMAGQASFAVKRSDKYVEGDDTLVPYSGKLEKMWHRLEDGIRSAMSYMNCKTIEDLRYLPDENFCLLSHSAKIERTVHANL